MKAKSKNAARRILQQSECKLPLDVKALVQNCGVTILHRTVEKSVTGILVVNGARATIMLNDWFEQDQQRFSLAHLFGHFVLHRRSAPLFVDFIRFNEEKSSRQARRLQEREANDFATELLMPEEVLRERFAERPPYIYSGNIVQALAAQFGVSDLVFALRLSQLGLTNP